MPGWVQKNTDFLADIKHARVLTVGVLREAAEMDMTVWEACEMARRYLTHRGYPVPDDPLAFATCGRSRMRDWNMHAQFVVKSSGEVLD